MPGWDNLALSAIMYKNLWIFTFLIACLLCLVAVRSAWAEPAGDNDGVSPVLIKIPDDSIEEKAQPITSSSSSKTSVSQSAPAKEAPAAKNTSKSKVKTSTSSKKASRTSGGFPWGKKYSRTSLKKHRAPSVPAPTEAPSPYKNGKNTSDSDTSSGNVKKASGASATINNVRKGRNISSKQASSDLPAQIVIGPPKNITVLAKGRTYPLSIRTTGIEDEYFVPIEAAGIKSIASLFGASSWIWSKESQTLSVTKNGRTNTLKVDQLKLADELGGRTLDVGIREINGQYCCPISILEDFLDVRVTVDGTKGKGWIEPLITSVRLDGSGSNLTLNVNASAPVSFSTFKLSKPDRYVIDIDGGVLDTSSLRVNHPEIGDIRLGQFTLGPAVSRIVVPTNTKLNITPPVSRTGTDFKFAISLPRASVAQYKNEKVTSCEVGRFGSSGNVSSSVTIGFSGPVMYEWQRLAENKNRFVIDFKRVIFPENKISKKISGKLVEQVRISQYAAKPVPITRVVLDLSDAAGVKVSSGRTANSICLEISEDKINLDTAAMSGSGSLSSTYAYTNAGGGKTVCIDAGHGGSDSGCVSGAYGYMEKDITLDICMKLADNLRRRGWNVILTRETDRDVTWAGSSNSQELGARVDIGAKGGADIFVSVHCNAAASSSAEGTSLHVYKRSDRALAECMHPHIMKASGRYDRGIQQDRFFVLVHSQMPAVLVETAFLSNSTEARLLGDPNYRQSIADGLADGICSYASRYLHK
ncbi:MAG: N-acetylmuramoyl-L-alanine amidase [Candidatus Bruticola sp.]